MKFKSGILSVIGTAGRKDDASKITPEIYDSMYSQLLAVIDDWHVDWGVSGGAAVADHLAVRAYLDGYLRDLTLFFPADFRDGRFVPNPDVPFNPGRTLNRYHAAFSSACGIDSLQEVSHAIEAGGRVRVMPGFHLRNLEVAHSCDLLLAFTFGRRSGTLFEDYEEGDEGHRSAARAGLKRGGTSHTWEAATGASLKRHVNLTRLWEQSLPSSSPLSTEAFLFA